MSTLAGALELPSFGRYEPVFRIAAGGMAEVYGARVLGDAGFTRWVAIKRILPELADDPKLVEMFLDEARLSSYVQSPHVVPTHDLGRASDGSPFLVMDLVVGATLASLQQAAVRAGGLLPIATAVEIAAQAAEGLHAAHEARSIEGSPLHIVHRDVSPRNVLVGIDGRARILDFGIALGELRSTRTAFGEVKGTQSYFSPEQAAGALLDRRTDVCSLGIVAWELLVGRRLRGPGAPLEARALPPPRLEAERPELGARLSDVVAKALEVDRERRWQRADELAHALREAWPTQGADISRVVATLGASAVQRIQLGVQKAVASSHQVELSDAPLTARPRQSTSRLKVYATSFVGRERDLAQVRGRLVDGERLVTLFGPGGIGKTRLAIEVAQRARDAFPGGVIFCDLTEARSAEGICYVVGAALGVPSMKGGDVRSIVTMLGDALEARPRTLVVLDNVEQAIRDVPETVGEWLSSGRRVSFLVTSRERLRLDAETLHELEPLTTSSLGARAPAAQLFLDRALKVRPDLVLDAAAEQTILQIVERLDGLPLAIELAASRVRNVELAALAAQLTDRFHALARGARDAVPRQATLDAAIRWSWDLLEEGEQALFAALAVFRGGFDERAAAAVADAEPAFVGLVLEQLVDKSLVRMLPGSRFGMLESIRDFALRELEVRGGLDEATERACKHFVSVAASWDAPGNIARPLDIERELDNLVAAFEWIRAFRASDAAQATELVTLALATEPVLGVRGPVTLAQALLAHAVTASVDRDIPPDLEARARLAWARTLFTLGQTDAADAQLAEARLVATYASNRRAQGWVALTEAEQAWARGSLPEVLDAVALAIDAAQSVGDLVLLARAFFRRGAVLLLRGEHAEARVALERAQEIATSLRYDQLVARARVSLAELHHDLGDVERAREIARAGTELAARVGDPWVETVGLSTLGAIALDEDPREALRLITLAHRTALASGNLRAEGLFLTFVGVAQEAAGLSQEAHATLEAAASASWRAGNQLGEALAQAYLGRLLARAGAIDEAELALETASSSLRTLGDRVRVVVAKLCAGHLHLARADRASLVGDRETAARHRDEARALVRAAHDEIARGLHSHDVRHALAVLEGDLEQQHDTLPPPAP
ncbi:MAG: protein kinase [Sandaracinaceae bacterium]|nr:protein kinase [Sandaracinaceae bacterium]